MFGIGLPEMIVILAIALIVVGPDKLPDLARSAAKWMLELKKTAESLKKELAEDNTLDSIKSELNNAVHPVHKNLLESSDQSWKTLTPGEGVNPAPDKTHDTIIEAETTVIEDANPDSPNPPVATDDKSVDKIKTTQEDSVPKKDSNDHPAC
jgi:sec-independent protein translocase protein TatB